MPSPAIRTLRPSDWPLYRDLRLRALAQDPSAFCSTHAEESQRTDEAWAARLAGPALDGHSNAWPFAAVLEAVPVGLAWVKLEGAGVAGLYQVWVAPEARGCGIGAALLDAAIAWARERHATALHLSVTAADSAAARLYRRAGFVDAGAPESVPGTARFEQAMTLALA